MPRSDLDLLNQLRMAVRGRLQAEEIASKRLHVLVEWQRRLIEEVARAGRLDVNLFREVLVLLIEAQHWHDAQANQVRGELHFLDRHSC